MLFNLFQLFQYCHTHCVRVSCLVLIILFQCLPVLSGISKHSQESSIVQSDWYPRQNTVWTQFPKYHRHTNNGAMFGKMFGRLQMFVISNL